MDAGDYTVQVELPSHAKLTDFKVVLNEQCELPVPHEWAELLANESRISPDQIAVHEKKGATMAVEDDDDDLDENAGNYNVAWLSLIPHSLPAQISFPTYSPTHSRGRESAPRDLRSVESTQSDL
jgi:hypothetical protein